MQSPNARPNAQIQNNELTLLRSFDAHEHAHNLRDWQQHYDQISAGNFTGHILDRNLDGIQTFTEYTSQALTQSCLVWPDSIWLGIPHQQPEHSRINGLSLETNDIMCRPGNTEFELVTPGDFHIYGIVIPQTILLDMAQQQNIHLDLSNLKHHERLSLPTHTLSAIKFVLSRLLQTEENHAPLPPQHLAKDLITMGLIDILKNETPNEDVATSYRHRHRIVQSARDFLEQHHDRPITLSELCQACHTSQRTLQNSFESILGLSPIQYLRFTRLNGVRRELKKASQQETVGDIAARWGFWHLGQFAKDYKNVFSELPSESLEK